MRVSAIAFLVLTSSAAAQGRPAWLAVDDSEAALRRVRALASRVERQEFERVFENLRDGPTRDDEQIALLLQRKAEVVARLQTYLKDGAAVAEAIGAALQLCVLGERSGRAWLAKALRSGTPAQRTRIVHALSDVPFEPEQEKAVKRFYAEQQIAAALLAQLDAKDPALVKAAIQTCGILGTPGVSEKFLSMLDRASVPDRSRILFWLGRGAPSQAVLEVAIRESARVEPREGWHLVALERCVKLEDPELRRAAVVALQDVIDRWPDDGARGYVGSRLAALDAIRDGATAADLPWLKKAVSRERGHFLVAPMVALLRLDPEAGRARLEKALGSRRERDAGLSVIAEVFRDSQDAKIVALVAGSGAEARSLVHPLLAVGGTAAAKELRRILPRLDTPTRARVQRYLDGPALATLGQELVGAGVMSAEVFDLASRRLASDARATGRSKPSLRDVFDAAGLLVGFDTETGMLPCRHDQLVLEFAAASRGGFRPEAVSEQWHRQHAEDFRASYTLRFVHAGRAYAAKVRNMSDWYDVERTVHAMNAALADAKIAERFLALPAAGQFVEFVFADPKKLTPLARKFHMPFGADLNEAREKGQAFEREMLQRLRKRK